MAFVAVGAAGCFTTVDVSKVGPLVRSIEIRGERVVIESCGLKYTEVNSYWIGPDGSGQRETDTALRAEDCSSTSMPTPTPEAP